MKLFKSLLVAPATIGLLAPFSAFAGEANLNDISKYSNLEHLDLANAFVNEETKSESLLAGGEGLVDSGSSDGGFSQTTTASFSVDTVIGSIDGNTTSETTSFDYQFNIGLSTSFTGEDSLDIAIDNGNASQSPMATVMGFDGGTADSPLKVDGVTYTFPVGGATMVVGDSTDLSVVFTGACTYSAFTDSTPDDCGTGNSIGAIGKGVTAALSYEFDSGFSMAGGLTSGQGEILGDAADALGLNAAYSTDSYGVAVAYISDDMGSSTEKTTWGLNGYYSFDLADISVGYETQEASGTDSSGYFVGLTFPEVGPGSVNIAAATKALYADSATEYLIYEASYSYPVNDSMTITPGIFIEETASGSDDLTGVAIKTSFSF